MPVIRSTLLLLFFSCLAGAAQAADEQPICADRPSKSSGSCTVPPGMWQVETGIVDWTTDKLDGVRTDATAWANTAVKYGLTNKVDLELWITPLETLSMRSDHTHQHDSSFGDTLFRVKYSLTSDKAPVQVTLDPFVKIPTANHRIGNGKVEGGLLVPVTIPIGKSPFTLSLDPELDLVADDSGDGRHLSTQQVVNLGYQLNKKVSVTTEIWLMRDWNPSGTRKLASWDGSLAYLVSDNLQIDGGANFGLTKETPDLELYTGVSARF